MKRPHQIAQLIFEIDVPSTDQAFSFQNDASSFIRNEVSRVLESILDEYDQPGMIIRIDELELSLENISFNPANMPFLREELRKQLNEQLSEQLHSKVVGEKKDSSGKVQVSIRAESEDVLEILDYYLDHGRLPWWASHIKNFQFNQEFLNLMESNPSDLIGIVKSKLSKEHVRERLVNQLNPELVQKLLIELIPPSGEWHGHFLQLVKAIVNRNSVKTFLKQLGLQPNSTVSQRLSHLLEVVDQQGFSIQQFLKNGLDDAALRGEMIQAIVRLQRMNRSEKGELLKPFIGQDELIETEEQLEQLLSGPIEPVERNEIETSEFEESYLESNEQEANDILAENAGLVIVQPYFTAFFNTLGFLEANQFKNEEMRHHAVYVLHYLASGESEKPDEHQVVLNKILCGIPIDQPITDFQGISDKEKQEANDLMQSVVENWKALKSTSVDGLRQMFMRREGHLRRENEAWVMNVEREGYDILLDKLPWGISMLRAPWLEEIIHVEW